MLNIIVPIKEVTNRKMYIGDSVNFAEARATKPNEAIANPKRLNVSLLKSSNIVNSSQNYQDWQILKSADSSKNYTSFKIENEIPTHEGAVAPARASLRSENEHRFNGKFFSLSLVLCEAPEFSQIAFGDFVKPCVQRNLRGLLQEGRN